MVLKHQDPARSADSDTITKPAVKRSPIDRRSPLDRRQNYNLDYFLAGGLERRGMWKERRKMKQEQREGWARVSSWSSIYVGNHVD